MVCIYCGGSTQVSNSRLQKRANTVWRRRQCTVCAAVFTTTEAIDLASAIMIATAKGLEPFDKDKLLISVYESCKHRQNALNDASALTQTIIGDIIKLTDVSGKIERDAIITLAQQVLERFDPVCSTVYTAYHRI